jgi:hypothetical protein
MIAYISFYLYISFLSFNDFIKKSKIIKLFFYISVVLFVGLRGNVGTDTHRYIEAFKYGISDVFSSDIFSLRLPYSEYGFILLNSIVKTFTNNYNILFIIIALLTYYFIFSSLNYYSKYFYIGFLVYFLRFMLLRDFNQIRAGLAISIVIYAIRFISKKKLIKYLFWIIIASSIHISTIIALPFYWISQIKFQKKHILFLIILSIIVNFTSFPILLAKYVFDLFSLGTSYVTGSLAYSSGLDNPVIWYQLLILIMYSFFEKILSIKQKEYYIIRNLYLFSILFLIIFNDLAVIGGRLSTIFATLEIFIIPSLFYVFKNKILLNILVIISLTILFYANIYSRLGSVYYYF